MTGLNEKALARMRAQLVKLLPDQCVLLEAIRTPDDSGSVTTTWQPVVGGTVDCRLDPLYYRQQPGKVGAVQLAAAHFMLTVPHDAPLAPHQRVTLADQTFRVLTVADAQSWRLARRAYLIRFD